jgi:hypothetical protein
MYNWKYQEALLVSDFITFYYLSNREAPNSLPEGISLRFLIIFYYNCCSRLEVIVTL